MLRRRATWVVAVLAAAAACKKEPAPPAVTTVAPSGSARAPEPDPWEKQGPAQPHIARPLFWAIEKDGKTTYALGTMHVGIDAEAQLPPLVWQKLDTAAAFAMETDLSDPAVNDINQMAVTTSLHAQLGEDEWQMLEKALTPEVARRMDKLKPMVAATMLQLRGLPMTAPMDGVLLGRAQNRHERIVYLEPATKEEALLEKWMDVRALKDMLDDLEHGDQAQKDMLAAYLAGDDKKLLALTDGEREEWKKHGRDLSEYDQQMEELLYQRNASWIAPLEALHASGGGFVAVGAMHLIGKRSVLDLLAQKGYKVTRITP